MANFFPLVANNSSNITSGFIGNRIEELQSGSNLDFTDSGLVNLDVTKILFSNNAIAAGYTNQVLTTWGNGVVYWGNGGGGTTRPIIEWDVFANANNQSFSDTNVASFLNNTYAAVFVNGVMQPTNSYIITGNTLTINTWLNTTDKIAIGPFGGGSSSGGISNINADTINSNSNTVASELGFSLITTPAPISNIGTISLNVPDVLQFRTNANIGNVANANFNSNALTFLAGDGNWIIPSTTPAGNTTEIQYNNAGILSGSQNLTFDGNNISTINIFERSETMLGNVISLTNASYFTTTLSTSTTFNITNAPAAPQVGSFILHISNSIAGVSFAQNIKWTGGISPILQSNTSTVDILGFYTIDSGSSYYACVLGLSVPV